MVVEPGGYVLAREGGQAVHVAYQQHEHRSIRVGGIVVGKGCADAVPLERCRAEESHMESLLGFPSDKGMQGGKEVGGGDDVIVAS